MGQTGIKTMMVDWKGYWGKNRGGRNCKNGVTALKALRHLCKFEVFRI
jgi:hypothetical protein